MALPTLKQTIKGVTDTSKCKSKKNKMSSGINDACKNKKK